MPSLGALWLKFHQTFKHSPRTAYYREIIRPKILDTPPIVANDTSCCEIHVLVSSEDLLNLLWTLKSFYYYSKRQYALCIHDDGSLTESDCLILKQHFPLVRIINRLSADRHILSILSSLPCCLEFRKNNLFAPRIFDFPIYSKAKRILQIDSDILFFSEPNSILERIENPHYCLNCFNRDLVSAYTISPELLNRYFNLNIIEKLNAGLGLIHTDSLNLSWIEEFLSLPDIIGHFWRIEQTLFALCSSRFGVELLPSEYDVRLDRGIQNCPSRHYVGKIRHLMYREGIRQLSKNHFLQKLSQCF